MFNRKDLLGLRDLSEEEIMTILETAKSMKEKIDNPALRSDELKRAVLLLCFMKIPQGQGCPLCLQVIT